MQYGSKSALVMSVLSVTQKLPNEVWKYPTWTPRPGRNSCVIEAATCQLYGRTPQPFRIAGSQLRGGTAVPKNGFVSGPISPLAAGLFGLPCGNKSPLASFHVRVVAVTSDNAGFRKSASVTAFPSR